MARVAVLDALGRPLGSTSASRAAALIASGHAEPFGQDPGTIRLLRAVERPPAPAPREPTRIDRAGQPLLLHICCGPCATWSVRRLREEGWSVQGYWYNPNVQPFSEHERRRAALERWAAREALPLALAEGYEMVEFLRQVAGHERFRERCAFCYRMRLTRTAEEAARRGIAAISTSLLISPYQDQESLRRIGDEVAGSQGLRFYFENLRRGYAESRRLAREAGLYVQRYCGCVYSEWEAANRTMMEPAARA